MSLISLSSVALYTLGKIGFKIAEKRQWLPGIVYHKISIRKLREGNLSEAEQYNSIAMRKNPSRDDVLLVHDIVSMQRDAQTAILKRRIGEELQKMKDLRRRQRSYYGEIQKLAKTDKKRYLLPGLITLTLINLSIYFFLFDRLSFLELLSGYAGLFVILSFIVLDRFITENEGVLNQVKSRELQAAISAMEREITVRRKSLSEYQNQLNSILIETNIGL